MAISLPILIATSLVGVGFCSWYFGHEDVKVSNNISVYTSSDVTKGTLSVEKAPTRLVFSQGTGESSDLTDGIDFYTGTSSYTKDDEIIIRYTLADPHDSISGSDFTFKVSFVGTSFSDYVKVNDSYSDATEDAGYDFSGGIETVAGTSTGDYGYFKYTLKLSDVIEYKSADIKPLTKEKYKALRNSLTDANLVITFIAN